MQMQLWAYSFMLLVSRQQSVECIPLPRHVDIGKVSFPRSSRYIGL